MHVGVCVCVCVVYVCMCMCVCVCVCACTLFGGIEELLELIPLVLANLFQICVSLLHEQHSVGTSVRGTASHAGMQRRPHAQVPCLQHHVHLAYHGCTHTHARTPLHARAP